MMIMSAAVAALIISAIACCGFSNAQGSVEYFGQPVGNLSELKHGVSGTVYIVDDRRLRLRQLNYDGKGQAVLFLAGVKGSSGTEPDLNGQPIPNEKGSLKNLSPYDNADIVLTLPSTLSTDRLAWLSVWCQWFTVNFGHVVFPSTVLVPKTTALGQLQNPTHGLSSDNVTIIDVITVRVDNFKFDGLEKDVFFVAGNDSGPIDQHVKLFNENGRATALGSSAGTNIVLTLNSTSSSRSILNFQFVGVFSYSAGNTLAQVSIPSGLTVPPHIAQSGYVNGGSPSLYLQNGLKFSSYGFHQSVIRPSPKEPNDNGDNLSPWLLLSACSSTILLSVVHHLVVPKLHRRQMS